jgi:hypothetical protein
VFLINRQAVAKLDLPKQKDQGTRLPMDLISLVTGNPTLLLSKIESGITMLSERFSA